MPPEHEVHPRPECVESIKVAIRLAVQEMTASLNLFAATSKQSQEQMFELVKSNQKRIERLDKIIVDDGSATGLAARVRANEEQIRAWRESMKFWKTVFVTNIIIIFGFMASAAWFIFRVHEHMKDDRIHSQVTMSTVYYE